MLHGPLWHNWATEYKVKKSQRYSPPSLVLESGMPLVNEDNKGRLWLLCKGHILAFPARRAINAESILHMNEREVGVSGLTNRQQG